MDPASLPDRRDLHRPSQQVGRLLGGGGGGRDDCHVTLTALSLLFRARAAGRLRSFEDRGWRDVPTCVRTTSTRCDVTGAAAEDSEGCAWLRVRAERAGQASKPVQACSQHGDCRRNTSYAQLCEARLLKAAVSKQRTDFPQMLFNINMCSLAISL